MTKLTLSPQYEDFFPSWTRPSHLLNIRFVSGYRRLASIKAKSKSQRRDVHGKVIVPISREKTLTFCLTYPSFIYFSFQGCAGKGSPSSKGAIGEGREIGKGKEFGVVEKDSLSPPLHVAISGHIPPGGRANQSLSTHGVEPPGSYFL